MSQTTYGVPLSEIKYHEGFQFIQTTFLTFLKRIIAFFGLQ